MAQKESQTRNPRTTQRRTRTPMAYYRSGAQRETTSPFKKTGAAKQDKISFFSRLIDGLIILVVLGAFIYSLIVGSSPKIVLDNNLYHTKDTYGNFAATQLKGFKNSNKMTFDEQGIIRALKQQFPEIANASISLPIFGQTPTFYISVSKPVFVLRNNSTDYLINSQGVAVAPSIKYPSIKGLPVVEDQTGFNVQAGHQVISSKEADFIAVLVAQCRHARVPISSMTLPPKAQELDLRTSDRPYYVKFYMDGDVMRQAGQFLATRHQFDNTDIQPSEYLDVRVSGRVFYK